MNKKIALLIAGATLAFGSAAANAQFKEAEDAIEYREAAMTLMGSHFGRMAPVAKKEAPYDKEAIKENVALLNTLASLPWIAYGRGTEGGRAKDKVWSDPDGFKQAQDKFKSNLAQLTSAADAGDFDAFRVAFGDVGKSCKSCHDSYRNKK